jgi:hypothetical protein
MSAEIDRAKTKPHEWPEVAALIPTQLEALRARQLNTIEKRDRASWALGQILVLGEEGFERAGESYEAGVARRKAHNNAEWARRAALEQTAALNEITPERAAKMRAGVVRDLPRYYEYAAAVQIITDFEGNYDEPPPESPVIKNVKAEAERRLEDLSDQLSYAMNAEQVALVESLTNRHSPFRRLWDIMYPSGGPADVLQIPLKSPYIRLDFRRMAERCKTQRELRLLAECYGLEAKAVRVEENGQKFTRITFGSAVIDPAI